MPLLRILLVSLFAAFAACIAASLIVFGDVDEWSLVALPFTGVGSIFLLAPAYGTLKERGMPMAGRYLLLLALGAVGGAVMLGFIFSGSLDGLLLGGFYGVTTAACWIALHFASRVLSAARRREAR